MVDTPLRVGVSAQAIAAVYPRLYHMAEAGAWPGIRRHGLLSTTALLDLFEVGGAVREAIESKHRRESVVITHHVHGSAVIRDQKPMDDKGLQRALQGGVTPREWYELLNGFVFFWVNEERLSRLLGAREYRARRQTIIVLNTRELLARHSERVFLSPLNSGATKPMPHPRGRDTFLPLAEYPFDSWKAKRRGRDAVVELAVRGGVPDAAEFVQEVREVGGGRPEAQLFSRT